MDLFDKSYGENIPIDENRPEYKILNFTDLNQDSWANDDDLVKPDIFSGFNED